MEETLVLYPAPLVGHLAPMVELCKLILTHQTSLSIHILITTSAPFNTDTISQYITTISNTIPSITFHNLPTVTLPPTFLSSAPNHETLLVEIFHLNTPHVHQALQSISKTYTIQALIVDFFCSHALPIASQLNLPTYYFFTTSCSLLAFFLYLPTIHRTTEKSLRQLNTYLDIPGLPPIHSLDMPKPLHERNHQFYKTFLQASIFAPKTAGVMVNTFEALEPRSIKAISDGLCIPNGPTPPVFCVGPLVTANTQTLGVHDECLRWLNSQPQKSVVFVCFGSMGVFSREQICEIAYGLERSDQRFLWVVRNPPLEQSKNLAVRSEEDPDLDSLLPEGFLDRTRDRGLVVKNWAPQVAVLSHDSVGGFVSHCGWNSVLEAVCAGVPIVAWPLYAEQRFNRVVLVQEMEVALWMNETESGIVTATEVEERVRELMESEKGDRVRKRVMVAKDEAKAALLSEDGTSRVALTKLVKSWRTQ